MSLKALISPQSVALVGANEKFGFGGFAARNLIQNAENCRFYFINPSHDTVLGVKSYKSMSDLPETVDCVELAIPKQGVNEQLELAGKLGIRAAVVYASGYTEEHTEEGRKLNDELKEIAARYDMDVLGPNCMGLLNVADGVNTMGLAMPEELMHRDPKVAILSHSGALSSAVSDRGNYPLAYQVSVGNGAVTTMEDFMDYFIGDEKTKVLALYMEGLKKPRLFLKCLKKAAEVGKPIVVLKTGRSEAAAKSASSHTGSLAGSFQSFEAVFKKYGVVSVNTFEELIVTSNMLAVLYDHMPESTKIAGFNLSGGGNVLMAEAAQVSDVEFAIFDDATIEKIRPYIPAFSTATNPLDATTDLFFKPANITGIVKAMSECPDVGYIVAGQDMSAADDKSMEVFVTGLARARLENPDCKPVVMNCITERDRNPEYRKILYDAGIPLLSSVAPSLQSLSYMNRYIEYRAEEHTLEIPTAMYDSTKTAVMYSETESKKILAAEGIPVPREVLIERREDIGKIQTLRFPLVAKVSSADIPHKSNVGGVKTGIENLDQAECAYEEILVNCRQKCPGACVDGIVFQEMAPEGQEFLVGVSNDPQLGPMVMVGLGGIFVEIFKDIVLLPAPLSIAEVVAALEELKAAPLLHGYRGSAELDIEALAEVVSKISDYALRNSESLKEMDVNPVIVYQKGEGAIAVDALIIKNA
ncbi:MAG: acetate--CoA ligase family protein [Clostridiales bacterium]|nr:acetate--CoA ligase family protein [Clostridiales bacterium]